MSPQQQDEPSGANAPDHNPAFDFLKEEPSNRKPSQPGRKTAPAKRRDAERSVKWVQPVDFPPLTLHCRVGNASRGVFCVEDDKGEFHDALVVNNGAAPVLIRVESTDFRPRRQTSRMQRGWVVGRTSPQFHKRLREFVEADEKLQAILGDGNLRFWSSDPASLTSDLRKTLPETGKRWFKEQLWSVMHPILWWRKQLSSPFMLILAVITILLAPLAVAEGRGPGGDRSAILLLAVASFILTLPIYFTYRLVVGDTNPRHLALITNRRALLMTFKGKKGSRRFQSDQALELPPADLASRSIDFFRRDYILCDVAAFDFKEALCTETVGFEFAVRISVFLKEKELQNRLAALAKSDNRLQSKVATRVIEELTRK